MEPARLLGSLPSRRARSPPKAIGHTTVYKDQQNLHQPLSDAPVPSPVPKLSGTFAYTCRSFAVLCIMLTAQ